MATTLTQQQQNFIGVGVSYPFTFSTKSGGISQGSGATQSGGIDRINQSLTQILNTALESRVGRRSFGSMFRSLVLMPNDPQMDVQIDYAVRTAIAKWEPRVVVGPVIIDRSQASQGILLINVSYTIIQSNVPANLVWPYYLSSAERQTIVT